jgi:hypothetical protein
MPKLLVKVDDRPGPAARVEVEKQATFHDVKSRILNAAGYASLATAWISLDKKVKLFLPPFSSIGLRVLGTLATGLRSCRLFNCFSHDSQLRLSGNADDYERVPGASGR